MSHPLLIPLTPELVLTLIQVHTAMDRALDDEDHELVSSEGVVDPMIASILERHGWSGPQFRALFYSLATAIFTPANGDGDEEGWRRDETWKANVALVNHPPDELIEPLNRFKAGFFDPRGFKPK